MARLAVWLAGCLPVLAALVACTGAPARARAVWLDRGSCREEAAVLNVYDRGEIRRFPLRDPDDSDGSDGADACDTEDVADLQLGLDRRGRGVLLRNREEVLWIDLDDDRRLAMDVPQFDNAEAEPVQLADNGDAVFWIEDGDLQVVPLASGVPLDVDDRGFVVPLTLPSFGNGRPIVRWAVSAPEINLLFVYTSTGAMLTERMSVVRYPAARGDSPALEVLATTEDMVELNQPLGPRHECADGSGPCGTGYVVDPAGDTLTVVDGAGTRQLLRWAWRDEPSFSRVAPLPPSLGRGDDPGVLDGLVDLAMSPAADILLFLAVTDEGNPVVVRWTVGAPAADVIPILGEQDYAWRPTDGGRALSVVGRDGPMIRVDAESFEVINASTTRCGFVALRPVVFSPDGRRAAWVCRDADEAFEGGAQVLRVSPGRFESYVGIPFVVRAIDDDGNALMYSEPVLSEDADGNDPDITPRTLYVLGDDEVLRRADDLDPPPLLRYRFGAASFADYVLGAALQ